jgi:hypothetical protein
MTGSIRFTNGSPATSASAGMNATTRGSLARIGLLVGTMFHRAARVRQGV